MEDLKPTTADLKGFIMTMLAVMAGIFIMQRWS